MGTDFLTAVIDKFGFKSEVFFNGEFCGTTDFQPRHGTGHLHFIRDGSVQFEHAGEAVLKIKGPAVVLYPRPFDHRLVVQHDSLANLFCANIAFKNLENNLIATALPACIQISANQSDEIWDTTEFLFRQAAKPQSSRQFVLDRLCDILVYEVIRHVVDQGNVNVGMLAGMADPGIRSALAAIHSEPSTAWSVAALATQASMSRTRFSTRFQKLVGTSPGRYLTNWRLTVAEGLLLQGDSVKSVADAVGFGTQPSFTKAFIDRNGLSPKKWVKNELLADI